MSWNDPLTKWDSLTGESAIWLSEKPRIDNGFQNVPVVGLDNIQSMEPLVAGNETVVNNIDG